MCWGLVGGQGGVCDVQCDGWMRKVMEEEEVDESERQKIVIKGFYSLHIMFFKIIIFVCKLFKVITKRKKKERIYYIELKEYDSSLA